MSLPTREQIRQRLLTDEARIEVATTLISTVGEAKGPVYVVDIVLIGDSAASVTVDIEKVNEDGTFTKKYRGVSVEPSAKVHLSPRYDIEHPIITLEGGAALRALAVGGTPSGVAIHWPSERF